MRFRISTKAVISCSAKVLLLAAIVPLQAGVAAGGAASEVHRAVLIVIDQCKAEYIDRFPMENLRFLQRQGTTFANATVGHLASETIVSHLVLGTGRLPRNLPWSDEILRDVGGSLGAKGALWMTAELSTDQMMRLLGSSLNGPTVHDEIERALGGASHVIGSKSYATWSFAGPEADTVVTLSDSLEQGPFQGWRRPAGRGLWKNLQDDSSGRFYVDCRHDYGTGNLNYPLKGNRYVVGDDPEHPGGDQWVASLAIDVMRERPNWSSIFMTMGGVDKAGHLLGVSRDSKSLGQDPSLSLEGQILAADRAVGTVLDGLRERGLLEETLIIITADHGALSGRFLGQIGKGQAYSNWYFGNAENVEYRDPPPRLRHLLDDEDVGMGVTDTMLRIWLVDPDRPGAGARVGRLVQGCKGVIEVFEKSPGGYFSAWKRDLQSDPFYSRMPPPVIERMQAWNDRVVPGLLSTMFSESSADVIGLMDDWTTYGCRGDHGGHQEAAQRVPLIITGPGAGRGVRDSRPARLVDIPATLLSLMGHPVPSVFDGIPLLGLAQKD